MASLSACPNCNSTCEETISANHFSVYTCGRCKTKYCYHCEASGHRCPSCGATERSVHDKVYAR